ncbi:hypothetical protein GmHk_04G010349 [Glycine max]|nr:hypothetical protein GmHk_04G010349 [Glycine max]
MLTENTPLIEDPPSPIERHGTFVPLGRDGILSTAIGRPEHPSCVRAVGSGITISHYYGKTSRGSSSSSTSITQKQLAEIIGSLKEEWRNELEQENEWSLKLSQRGSQYSPLVEADIQLLGARVSTKGSNAKTIVNPSGEEHVCHMLPTMGFMAYADDVVRVSVENVVDGEAQVLFVTSEIQYVRQTLHTFIARPKNLVKIVSHEDSSITPKKVDEPVQRSNKESTDDPLRQLIRALYDIYEKPIELLWEGKNFHLPNAYASFFLTYSYANEIISGDKCLNIAILQLWTISSLGHASVYRFLELQSIHNAKDRRAECQQYIETWGPLAAGCSMSYECRCCLVFAMKTLKTTVDGKADQAAPQWIEAKSHVQNGGYECGYYVMHWMWNIWFGDGTSLDMETITTIRNKWVAYFVKVKDN